MRHQVWPPDEDLWSSIAAGDEAAFQYERERYGLTGRRCYRVVPGFPRLTSRDVPTGVRSVSYSVELDQCAPFLLTERDLAQLLRQHTPEEVP